MNLVEASAKIQTEVTEIMIQGVANGSSEFEIANKILKYTAELPTEFQATFNDEIAKNYFKFYSSGDFEGFVLSDSSIGRLADLDDLRFMDSIIDKLPQETLSSYRALFRQADVLMTSRNITREQAVRTLVEAGNFRGLTVKDAMGRNWKVTTIMQRQLRDSMKNTNRQVAEQIMRDLDTDIYHVSSHPNPRKKCSPYEGRLVSNDGRIVSDRNGNKIKTIAESETSIGDGDGLFGFNCRHTKSPYVEGKSFYRGEDVYNLSKNIEQEYKRYNSFAETQYSKLVS